MSNVLKKGAYALIDYDGNKLPKTRNGLYLKKVLYLGTMLFLVHLCKIGHYYLVFLT